MSCVTCIVVVVVSERSVKVLVLGAETSNCFLILREETKRVSSCFVRGTVYAMQRLSSYSF